MQFFDPNRKLSKPFDFKYNCKKCQLKKMINKYGPDYFIINIIYLLIKNVLQLLEQRVALLEIL